MRGMKNMQDHGYIIITVLVVRFPNVVTVSQTDKNHFFPDQKWIRMGICAFIRCISVLVYKVNFFNS